MTEEDGLEWCLRGEELVFLGNAVFWSGRNDGRGYFSAKYAEELEQLIAAIPERKRLIRGWK